MVANPNFSSNQLRVNHRADLQSHLASAISKWQSSELFSKLDQANVPMGIVRQLSEAMASASSQNLVIEEVVDGVATKRITSLPFQTA